MPARQDAVRGTTASTILEVANGLRWRDPQLSAALAEHAVRLAGGDAEVRGAAERAAVLALGQLDRGVDVVARALPQLREAERVGRVADAASLRCELASAAVRCEDADLAEALLGPLADGAVLPSTVRVEALTAWAGARALRGDVEGADAAAEQAQGLLAGDGGPDVLRGIDLDRTRARARRRRGDPAGALTVLRAAPEAGDPAGDDAGRRAALLVADRVDLLLDLHRMTEARAEADDVLRWVPEVSTALPLGRIRCALARRAHLPAGELDAAEALARAAHQDLAPRGHDAQTAEALQVLAAVAEARGDLPRTADALRRAHTLELAAHDAVADTRVALTAALAAPAASRESPRVPALPAEPEAPAGTAGPAQPPKPALVTEPAVLAEAAPPAEATPRRTRSSRRAGEQRASETVAGTSGGAPPDGTTGAPVREVAVRPAADTTDPDSSTPEATEATEASSAPPAASARHRGEVRGRGDESAGSVEGAAAGSPVGAPDNQEAHLDVPRRRGRYRENAAPSSVPAPASADRSFDDFSTAPSSPAATTEPAPELGVDRQERDGWPSLPVIEVPDPSDPLGLGHGGLDALRAWEEPRAHDHLSSYGTSNYGGASNGSSSNGSNGYGRTSDASARDGASSDPGRAPARDAGESSDDWRTRRARERWESAASLLPRRAGGQAPAATRGALADALAQDTERADDDELARELALTLVGLLAEHGDSPEPPPSRAGGEPGSTEARTGVVPARPPRVAAANGDGRGTASSMPPPVSRAPSTTHDRPDEGPLRSTGAAVSPGPEGPAVPPARRADDSGAKLADLLAEAMDEFRRTGPDPAPGTPPPAHDSRRVRR